MISKAIIISILALSTFAILMFAFVGAVAIYSFEKCEAENNQPCAVSITVK